MFAFLLSLLLALLVPAAGTPAATGHAPAVESAVVPAPAQRPGLHDEQVGRAPAVVPVVPIHPPTVAPPTDVAEQLPQETNGRQIDCPDGVHVGVMVDGAVTGCS